MKTGRAIWWGREKENGQHLLNLSQILPLFNALLNTKTHILPGAVTPIFFLPSPPLPPHVRNYKQ